MSVRPFAVLMVCLVAACGGEAGQEDTARSVIDTTKSADGTSIAYEASGAGAPALVFVHGWSCDRSYWDGQIGSFAPQHRVVAIDLAGHGESGVGRTAWTIAAFGEDVAAVVKKLSLERVILIGHSSGGNVIVEAARRLPGRVAGLVWVDVYKRLETPLTPQQVEGFVASFRTNFPEKTRAFVRSMFPPGADQFLVDRVAMDMSSAPTDVALPALVATISFDREIPAALQELKLPVVAINSDHQPTDTASLKRHGVDVVVMTGVGHFLMMEDSERFNGILKTVIEKFAQP